MTTSAPEKAVLGGTPNLDEALYGPIRGRSATLRRGLALKMVGATFPIIAAVVLVTQIAVGFTSYRQQLGALEARADLILRLTAEAIARPLWNLDRPVYESQIRAIARDSSFIKAEITDTRGVSIFGHQRTVAPGEGRIAVSVPVMEPNADPPVPLGRLELVLSTAELASGLQYQLMIGMVAFVVLLLSFSATVHLILRRLVLRPLGVLLAAMGRVERKQWQTADWSSGDELGRVTDAFNRMVDRLRSGDEAQRLLQELRIAQQQLTENNAQLARANKLVLDSINYARRIQTALLPSLRALDSIGAETEVIWEPRDIVGGDYYWIGRHQDRAVLILVDCTGHGVPGALMTMIVASVIDHVLQEARDCDPAEMLAMIDRRVRTLLRQDQDEGGSDDGMDAAICVYDPANRTVDYAGANIPLMTVHDGEVTVVKADRRSLGYRTGRRSGIFTTHRLTVAPGMTLFIGSDGVIDQLGPSGRLFGRRRLAALLAAESGRPLGEQMRAISAALAAYRGSEACLDDVTLLACRPVP